MGKCKERINQTTPKQCRFTIDVLQKIKKYTVTSICVIVEVLTKTHAKEETVYEYYNTNYEV